MDNNRGFEIEGLIDMSTISPIEMRFIIQCASGVISSSTSTASAATSSGQFKISKYCQLMTKDHPGAFIEIVYPSLSEIESETRRKHHGELLGCISTMAANAFPLASNEPSARGYTREERSYEYKSRFAKAALGFAKLRSIVEARDGNVDAIDILFGRMWGIEMSQVKSLPHIRVDGSEVEKISALDNRPYPMLIGHPANTGGFIINMAAEEDVSPETIGSNMPINWCCLLAAAEIFAFNLLHVHGEVEYQKNDSVRVYLDVVEGSQPVYVRSNDWENFLVEKLSDDDSEDDFMSKWKKIISGEERSSNVFKQAIDVINQFNRDIALPVNKPKRVYDEYDLDWYFFA